MKLGAVDFVVKPFENSVLMEVLKRAFGDKGMPGSKAASHMLWGSSESMVSLRKIVDRVAATDANILITGENGTSRRISWQGRFTDYPSVAGVRLRRSTWGRWWSRCLRANCMGT